MFYNHLKVAIRTIWRQKGLSFINLVGLSVGIGCFSLFLLYAINEFSFNRFHQNKDRIYQVVVWRQPVGNQTEVGSGTFLPMPLGPAMESELPGVEKAVRYKPSWKKSFVRAHGQLSQAGVTLVDTSFLSVFSFPLIEGEISSALDDPYKIVLTEKTADRLFGDRHVIGEQLQIKLED
ncbi:MAG: ABC transporter permease, partial [Saprospiraceae bacterium]|nr:ABC transporter permease [Saprospiraceae bacterium]